MLLRRGDYQPNHYVMISRASYARWYTLRVHHRACLLGADAPKPPKIPPPTASAARPSGA